MGKNKKIGLLGRANAYSIPMLEFLPQKLKNSLRCLNLQKVYEIRIRLNRPITVNYDGTYRYLGQYGLANHGSEALCCSQEEIADCVYRAGNYSLYAVEEQLKEGYLTTSKGERIGLGGEYVFEKGQPITIRNYTSLCIRVPHEIIGCAREVYQYCMSDIVCNLLLMSPPGIGKTTILRDLARILSEKTRKNILICDERGEIAGESLGESCDVISHCSKERAFEAGIRALRPDIIVTDELTRLDLQSLNRAVSAGVCVIATAHFSSIERVEDVFFNIFDKFVLLDELHIGKIKKIYDAKKKEIALC